MLLKPAFKPISACCLPGEDSTPITIPTAAVTQIALEAENSRSITEMRLLRWMGSISGSWRVKRWRCVVITVAARPH